MEKHKFEKILGKVTELDQTIVMTYNTEPGPNGEEPEITLGVNVGDSDAVNALICAMESSDHFENLVLSASRGFTINKLISKLKNATDQQKEQPVGSEQVPEQQANTTE